MCKRILLIGKTPPPIGGVTIHVSRLIGALRKEEMAFNFIELSLRNMFFFIFIIKKYRCVHLHSSHPFVRLYLTFSANMMNVKSVVTFHGDLGRYASRLKNLADKITLKIATKPIVLNSQSLLFAKKMNNGSEMISAFIPPNIKDEYLSSEDHSAILIHKNKYDLLFCINAYNLTYDKNGEEIYGIFEVIEVFRKNHSFGLIFSDPSGVYQQELSRRKIEIPPNVCLIKGNHSFYKVMMICDVSIRNTTTDGDSLSVKESLFLRKVTLATDIVSRPAGCILYRKGTLENTIASIKIKMEDQEQVVVENGLDRLIDVYKLLST